MRILGFLAKVNTSQAQVYVVYATCPPLHVAGGSSRTVGLLQFGTIDVASRNFENEVRLRNSDFGLLSSMLTSEAAFSNNCVIIAAKQRRFEISRDFAFQ